MDDHRRWPLRRPVRRRRPRLPEGKETDPRSPHRLLNMGSRLDRPHHLDRKAPTMVQKPFIEILFPRTNRRRAVVAFLRTAWQTISGTGSVAGAGTLALTAADLVAINWVGLGLGTLA